MKKFILLMSLALLTTSASVNVTTLTYKDVFICASKGGKKYHFSKTCRGLNACKATIKKMSLEEAKKIGKTICGWED
jgi:hypothetical protein